MSQKITPDNLDKWLFNLEEGNLTSSEKRELQDFLSSHPDLKEEAAVWKMAHLSESPLTPYAFESELHSLATNHVMAYRRWAAFAGLFLLVGGTAFYLFFADNESSFDFNFSNSIGMTSENNLSDKNDSNTTPSDNKNNFSSDDFNTALHEINAAAHFNDHALSGNFEENPTSSDKSNDASSALSNEENGIDKVNKKRDQVSIDIVNEIKITIEKEYEYVTEENQNQKEESNILSQDVQAILPLIENKNEIKIANHKVSDIGSNNKKNKHHKYKLDPNPTFTNLRDHILLATNNNLVDHYGGFAGGMIAPRFTLNYRNNWTGNSSVNSQNAVISYDQIMRKLKTGIGFTAKYDSYNNGTISDISVALTVSPKLKMGRGITLEPFATMSYSQKNVKQNSQLSGTFIEPNRGGVAQLYQNGTMPDNNTAYSPDLKIGTVFQHKKFWAAASVDQLLKNKETLYSSSDLYRDNIEVKTTVGTDYIHKPESGIIYSPQFSVYHHNGMQEYWLGLTTRFRQLVVGASVSQQKELIAVTGFQMHSLKLLYQFDMTKSVLMDKVLPSHEISVRIALKGNNKNSKSIFK